MGKRTWLYPLAVAVLAPTLVANVGYNAARNYELFTARGLVDLLFRSAIIGDEETFNKLKAGSATFDTWDQDSAAYKTAPLTRAHIKGLADECVVSSLHTCNGTAVQIDWSCQNSDPRYSMANIVDGKVQAVVGFSPPIVCTNVRPAE